MKKTMFFLTCLIAYSLLLFGSPRVKAQVVINEVFPNPDGSSELNEFIELFNLGVESVTITGWQISDTQGAIKTYVISEGTLDSGAYLSFRRSTTGIALNNTGDGVELKDASGVLKNSMSFGETKENRSFSRIPNGTGDFVADTDVTELSANTAPSTPEATSPPQVSTPSPAPILITASPSPTKTPSPTKSPTPTPTKTPAVTKTAAPLGKISTPVATVSAQTSEVLGVQVTPDNSKNSTREPPINTKNKISFLPFILVFIGLCFIAVPVFSIIKNVKKGYTGESEEQGSDIS